MKLYVLVGKDKDGKPTFQMPTSFGRRVRAYPSEGRAKAYAKEQNAIVIELDLKDGVVK